MGIWRIGADVLAGGRFAISPLAETLAVLGALTGWERGTVQRHWADGQRPEFERWLAGEPVTAALIEAAFRPTWTADFISTPPRPGDRTFHDELRRVRETPPEVARADLEYALTGPLPQPLRVPDLPHRAAELLDWVWTRAVRPDWGRRRRLLEADIVSRTQWLSSGGWAAALEGLRPGLRWLGDGRLRINAYNNPPRDLRRAQLYFVPTTSSRGWFDWNEPDFYAIVYPCQGLLADAHQATPPGALSALIGPVRARVLTLLEAPMSTTQLVAVTGYTLGTVGGHLKVLLDSGLARRRRSGRSVLYYRTPTADQLIALGPVTRGTGKPGHRPDGL
ncbi:MAG TPA: helix-turn-helix domain-containing protein [Streptosporangiaceae bacterium]|jgi:DNA-binding transcriptional ArsR family regulator|nr:helix-turn-helix domain-containing protein [Streptosporangiaceae bacterium]